MGRIDARHHQRIGQILAVMAAVALAEKKDVGVTVCIVHQLSSGQAYQRLQAQGFQPHERLGGSRDQKECEEDGNEDKEDALQKHRLVLFLLSAFPRLIPSEQWPGEGDAPEERAFPRETPLGRLFESSYGKGHRREL